MKPAKAITTLGARYRLCMTTKQPQRTTTARNNQIKWPIFYLHWRHKQKRKQNDGGGRTVGQPVSTSTGRKKDSSAVLNDDCGRRRKPPDMTTWQGMKRRLQVINADGTLACVLHPTKCAVHHCTDQTVRGTDEQHIRSGGDPTVLRATRQEVFAGGNQAGGISRLPIPCDPGESRRLQPTLRIVCDRSVGTARLHLSVPR